MLANYECTKLDPNIIADDVPEQKPKKSSTIVHYVVLTCIHKKSVVIILDVTWATSD